MSDNKNLDAFEAMLSAVRTLEQYFPKAVNVSSSYSNIKRGSGYWFIATPGAFPNTRLDSRDVVYQWQNDCDLFVRYKTEAESIGKLIEVRWAIIKLLHTPRLLRNVNVTKVTVTGDRIKQDTMPPAQPNFIIQPLLVTIEQIVKR